jgi:hypothetical protein
MLQFSVGRAVRVSVPSPDIGESGARARLASRTPSVATSCGNRDRATNTIISYGALVPYNQTRMDVCFPGRAKQGETDTSSGICLDGKSLAFRAKLDSESAESSPQHCASLSLLRASPGCPSMATRQTHAFDPRTASRRPGKQMPSAHPPPPSAAPNPPSPIAWAPIDQVADEDHRTGGMAPGAAGLAVAEMR